MKKILFLLSIIVVSTNIIAQDTLKINATVTDEGEKVTVSIKNDTSQALTIIDDSENVAIYIKDDTLVIGEGAKVEAAEVKQKSLKIAVRQKEIDSLQAEIEKLRGAYSIDFLDRIDSIQVLVEKNKKAIDSLEGKIKNTADDDEEKEIECAVDDDDDDCDDAHSKHWSWKTKKKFRGHWAGIQFGANSYLSSTQTIKLPTESDFMSVQFEKSFEFSLNPLQYSIPFFNRYVGAVIGLGITFNNYELIHNNYDLGLGTNNELIYIQKLFDYKKNRFKTTSLTAPILIEFQIPTDRKDRRTFISAGIIGTFNMCSKMKNVYYNNNEKIKEKNKINFPINKFNYLATARIGHRNLYLYVNYTIIPLFDKESAPELYPVSAGIGWRF